MIAKLSPSPKPSPTGFTFGRLLLTPQLFLLRVTLICSLVAALGVQLLASNAFAEDLESTARQIFLGVMSPFCPGRSLNDCPSTAATDLKDEIKARLAKGESAEQIDQVLFARYGDEIRAIPRMGGFDSVAWAAPLLFVVFGGLVIALWVRRQSSGLDSKDGSSKGPAETVAVDPAMEKRIAEELRRLD